jgi:hypothetical protein
MARLREGVSPHRWQLRPLVVMVKNLPAQTTPLKEPQTTSLLKQLPALKESEAILYVAGEGDNKELLQPPWPPLVKKLLIVLLTGSNLKEEMIKF